MISEKFIRFCMLIGSSLRIGTSHSEDLNLKSSQIENGLRHKVFIEGESLKKMNLLDRMEYYHVPGVSIAVVNEGQMEWAKGYGHVKNDPHSPHVDEQTLFQAGSVSKPITAFGALLLVQQGKIGMDEDVNAYLKRWKIPDNDLMKTEKVTLRRLLSHTAGTSVSGFPGYPIESVIPSVVEVLDGKKIAVNTDPVRVVFQPGTKFKYSGGGTTIVQLLIEDVTGEPFENWMENNVLKPLGMNESTFKQPLSAPYAGHAAYGYHNGIPVKGGWHIYPEMAAAGLWSTPRDLAKFILAIQSALKNGKGEPLHLQFIKEMLTRQKAGNQESESGLGLFVHGQGQNLVFEHKGQDEGFIAYLYAFVYRSKGAVIMMNNDAGWILMEEILSSIADANEWPDSAPIIKKKVKIDPSSLLNFIGLYVHEDDELEISRVGDRLFLNDINGPSPFELHPSSDKNFFIKENDFTIEFPTSSEKNENLILIDSVHKRIEYQRVKN